jgi:mannose-6-phosphate isomerase
VGESWEIADLASTSTSGGGGGAAVSVIRSGAMAGRTIADAIASWGEELLGASGVERARAVGERTGAGRPAFPLLIKYLDASEHLSVQVHPSPAYARAHAGAHLKTETWFVVEAEETALPDGTVVQPSVFAGLRGGVAEDAFRAHIAGGTVAGDLRSVAARAGDCHTLPSGTVHALGGGVLVAEVQTPSDTTFRVYDWAREYGRPDRELHIDEAVSCIDFGSDGAAPVVRAADGGRAAWTEFYTIDAVHGGADLAAITGAEAMAAVMVTAGEGEIVGAGEAVAVRPGTTVLVPASRAGEARLVGGDGLRSLVIGLGEG